MGRWNLALRHLAQLIRIFEEEEEKILVLYFNYYNQFYFFLSFSYSLTNSSQESGEFFGQFPRACVESGIEKESGMVLRDGWRLQILQDEQISGRSLKIFHAEALREQGARGSHHREQMRPQGDLSFPSTTA